MINDIIEKIEYRNYTILVWRDDLCINPRKNKKTYTTFVSPVLQCYGARDKHDVHEAVDELYKKYVCAEPSEEILGTMQKLERISETEEVCWLPLYTYNHEGISYFLGNAMHNDFPGDCELIGLVYMERPERCSKNGAWKGMAKDMMKMEVNWQNVYFHKMCYGFTVIDPQDNILLEDNDYFEEEGIQLAIIDAKAFIDNEIASASSLITTEEIPEWAICYLEYGDKDCLTDEEIALVDEFVKENFPHGYIMEFAEGDAEPGFTRFPAFGLPCNTYTMNFYEP